MSAETVPVQELQEISECRTQRTLKRWLSVNGIYYVENARGWPVVSRMTLRHALGAPVEAERYNAAEPDFAGFR